MRRKARKTTGSQRVATATPSSKKRWRRRSPSAPRPAALGFAHGVAVGDHRGAVERLDRGARRRVERQRGGGEVAGMRCRAPRRAGRRAGTPGRSRGRRAGWCSTRRRRARRSRRASGRPSTTKRRTRLIRPPIACTGWSGSPIGSATAGVDPGRERRQRARHRVERGRPAPAPSGAGTASGIAKRDREGAVVGREDRVLDPVVVGGGGMLARRRRLRRAGAEAIEARVVDDARLLELLARRARRRSLRATPAPSNAGRWRRSTRSAASSMLGAVARVAHAGDARRSAGGREQAAHRGRRASSVDAGAAQHVAAHAPTRTSCAGSRGRRDPRRRARGTSGGSVSGGRSSMSSSAAPAASSAVEQVGIVVAQQAAQPAEEGVRVAHLRRALALPRAEGRRPASAASGSASRSRIVTRAPRSESTRARRAEDAGDCRIGRRA